MGKAAHLETLLRRREHVDARLKDAEAHGKTLTYDAAERAALSFAIDLVEESIVAGRDESERRRAPLRPRWLVEETVTYSVRADTEEAVLTAFEEPDPRRRRASGTAYKIKFVERLGLEIQPDERQEDL